MKYYPIDESAARRAKQANSYTGGGVQERQDRGSAG